MKKKIYIKHKDAKDAKALMAEGLSKATAYRAIKRGYYYLDYHQKEVVVGKIDSPFFANGNCLRMAWSIYYRHFDYFDNPEDCVGEAVLRMLEVSGISQDPKFLYTAGLRGMQSFIKNWHKGGSNSRLPMPTLEDYAQVSNPDLWLTLALYLSLTEKARLEAYLAGQRVSLPKRLKTKIKTLLMGNQAQELKEVDHASSKT